MDRTYLLEKWTVDQTDYSSLIIISIITIIFIIGFIASITYFKKEDVR